MSRCGPRENSDHFTDKRALKAQEPRGVRGGMPPPPENFFNFYCLKCPLLASGVNRTKYLQVAFFLDGALQTYELFHQSQCPCCNECAPRQVLSILSVISSFVNMFLVTSKPTHSFCTRMWWLAGWKNSVMLGYIPESISFKVAATVASKVLASLHSQSLCHKVISASRLKGDSKESSWNVENRSNDVLHVSFDASSIEGTANRHCTAVSWWPLPNRVSNSLIRWSTRGIVRFLLEWSSTVSAGLFAQLHWTWEVFGFCTVMSSFLAIWHALWNHFAWFSSTFWCTEDYVLTTSFMLLKMPSMSQIGRASCRERV